MTGFKGTPGPWEPLKGLNESDEMRCAVVAVRNPHSYLLATIENGAPGDFCDTEFANAKAISAVPVMIEALVNLLKCAGRRRPDGHYEFSLVPNRDVEAARDALKVAGIDSDA